MGKLLQPVSFNGNDCEGISYCRDVQPSTRDRIVRVGEFVPIQNITNVNNGQSNQGQPLQNVELNEPGYALRNVPPESTQVKSKFDLFRWLFLFASFYLQFYPGKTVSFFDFLLFLMEQATFLTLTGLIALDSVMCQDFAANPEWNWSQHRTESIRSIQHIVQNKNYQMSSFHGATTSKSNNKNKNYGGNNGHNSGTHYGGHNHFGYNNNFNSGMGYAGNGKGKGKKSRAVDPEEPCRKFNAGECNDPNCKCKHVCGNCHEEGHVRPNCPH